MAKTDVTLVTTEYGKAIVSNQLEELEAKKFFATALDNETLFEELEIALQAEDYERIVKLGQMCDYHFTVKSLLPTLSRITQLLFQRSAS
ncbi:hypothetical protein F7734_09995 [Scytonema sp. UIC 10036]|uniref:hypothetical protein n=1 Tax=Scytonema sp. UIC 10036 TaxID=2304196 RepID=UPI0012DAEC9D|nr:hypothetical protein [Scytonema sp. UIC 10036]MUG92762.1 hypothetical protein [Scytonema sp. UIC 10036]